MPKPEVTVSAHIKTGKDGHRTSEFWKSIAVHLVGMLITAYGMWKGSEAIVGFGAVVLGMSNGAYSLSRGMAKKVVPLILPFFLCTFLMGCCGSGVVRADAIEPTLHRVVDKYNTYVSNDEALTPLQERANLRDGELLLKVVREAQTPATEE